MVGHRDVKAVGLNSGVNENVAIGWRVQRRVLDQVGQGDRGDSRIDFDLGLLVGIHAQGMSADGVTNLRGGGVDDVGRCHPLRLEMNRGRVDACHVQNVLEQSRQPIQFDERGTGLFLALLRLEVPSQVLDGDPNRRDRRLQVVAERREECGRQVGLLPHEVGGLTFAEKLCPLDGDGDHAGDGVQGAEIDGRRHRREQSDGFRAVTQRHDERASVLVTHAHVTAVGPLACVELQCATRLRERRVQRSRRQR